MLGLFILDDNNKTISVKNTIEWAKWFGANRDKRIVNKTNVGYIVISTVFLGLDHSNDGIDLELFETMVFNGELDQECIRCATWKGAEKMHERMVDKVINL